MIRFCWTCIWNTVRASLWLLLALCVAEVGLRARQVARETEIRSVAHQSLTVPSYTVHHQLHPLFQTRFRNPDTGQTVPVRTNSYGLRGPEPLVPKPWGTVRVLCLGDENVLGLELDEPDVFTSRLAERLQSRTGRTVEVLNAAVPGYCPLLSYLQLRHQLLSLQPDLVVLSFDMGDVADDYRYRRLTATDPRGRPVACPNPVLRNPPTPAWLWLNRFALGEWLRVRLERLSEAERAAQDRRDIANPAARYAWLEDDPPDWSLYIRQSLQPIAWLKELADGVGASFVLATYPVPWQVSPTASSGKNVRRRAGVPQDAFYTSNAPFQILADFAARHHIPFCNTTPAFRAHPQPDQLFLRNAPHFSASGHDLYAEQLAGFLLTVFGAGEPSRLTRPPTVPRLAPQPLTDAPTPDAVTPSGFQLDQPLPARADAPLPSPSALPPQPP